MNAPREKKMSDGPEYASMAYPMTLYPSEEGGYVAEIEDLPGCLSQGETAEEAAAALEECKAAWIEAALASGIEIPPPRTDAEYSGRFVLRMPRSLHRRLAWRARQDGVSLNTEVATLLAAALESKDVRSEILAAMRAMVADVCDACPSSGSVLASVREHRNSY